MQACFVNSGIFVRGAITIGHHFASENIIFSQALVDGYKVESTEAVFPRIVISKKVIDMLKRTTFSKANRDILNSMLKYDDDGLVFLDYLSYMSTEGDDPENDFELGMDKHKEYIEAAIRDNDLKKVKSKYLWVAEYHKKMIKNLCPRRTDLLISVPNFSRNVI